MEVAHRRADVAVSQQTLDGVDINAGFEQAGGESVPQGVDAAALGQTGGIAERAGAGRSGRKSDHRLPGSGKPSAAVGRRASTAATSRASAARAACSDSCRLYPGGP